MRRGKRRGKAVGVDERVGDSSLLDLDDNGSDEGKVVQVHKVIVIPTLLKVLQVLRKLGLDGL